MSVKIQTLEKILRWSSAGVALVYAVVFFFKLMSSYWARHITGLEIDWTVPTNPQSMIALCLVTASVALWFLRDSGSLLAELLFGVIIAFFAYWAFLTWGIRINMGVDAIPQVGRLGNFWIGATWIDVGACLFTVGFLILNFALLLKKQRTKQATRPVALHPSHT
jgi:hypothetical protein